PAAARGVRGGAARADLRGRGSVRRLGPGRPREGPRPGRLHPPGCRARRGVRFLEGLADWHRSELRARDRVEAQDEGLYEGPSALRRTRRRGAGHLRPALQATSRGRPVPGVPERRAARLRARGGDDRGSGAFARARLLDPRRGGGEGAAAPPRWRAVWRCAVADNQGEGRGRDRAAAGRAFAARSGAVSRAWGGAVGGSLSSTDQGNLQTISDICKAKDAGI